MFSLLLASLALAQDINVGVDAVNFAADFEADNEPANNNYGTPATMTYINNGSGTVTATVTAKCGSFIGLIFQQVGLTSTEISQLTGNVSPYAADWYNAIDLEKSTLNGVYSLQEIDITDIETGDLLVSKYSVSGDTGHAMIVAEVRSTVAGDDLSEVYTHPTRPTDEIYLLTIYDSTKFPHGDDIPPEALAQGVVEDSRHSDLDSNGAEDQGMGVGSVVVYTDSAGVMTGWRWSYHGSFYPLTSRPLIVGRLVE